MKKRHLIKIYIIALSILFLPTKLYACALILEEQFITKNPLYYVTFLIIFIFLLLIFYTFHRAKYKKISYFIILLSILYIIFLLFSYPLRTHTIKCAGGMIPNETILTKHFSYSTQGASVSVSEKTEPFNFTASELLEQSKECENKQSKNYFDELISKFDNTTETTYDFKYIGESQGSDTFTVTILPNKPNYSSLGEFKKDFDLCYAGGKVYPTMLNDNWLLFTSSCGSGAADGSGRPIGCQEISDIVDPTIKLN